MPDTKRPYKIIDQFNGDIIATFDSEKEAIIYTEYQNLDMDYFKIEYPSAPDTKTKMEEEWGENENILFGTILDTLKEEITHTQGRKIEQAIKYYKSQLLTEERRNAISNNPTDNI